MISLRRRREGVGYECCVLVFEIWAPWGVRADDFLGVLAVAWIVYGIVTCVPSVECRVVLESAL